MDFLRSTCARTCSLGEARLLGLARLCHAVYTVWSLLSHSGLVSVLVLNVWGRAEHTDEMAKECGPPLLLPARQVLLFHLLAALAQATRPA